MDWNPLHPMERKRNPDFVLRIKGKIRKESIFFLTNGHYARIMMKLIILVPAKSTVYVQ